MRQTITIAPEEIARQLSLCDQVADLLSRSPGPKRAFVDTYGCQQNEADSERLRGYLARMGYTFTSTEEGADLVLLNTCAIREHAEQRVFGNVGALSHTKRRHPDQIICVCGCMARQDHVAKRLRQSFPYVDLVFGPQLLWQFPQLLLEKLSSGKRVFATDDVPGSVAEGIPVVRQNGLKAWVSVMYGCNNFCTYCIVPYVRGRERSRQPEAILAEVRQLVQEGYKDITLLGQNVNSYGKDLGLGVDFAWLLEQVNAIPGTFLIRFMTSHPKDASPRLFDAMASCEKVAPALHLPFQSGSSWVLKAMNRGYTREHYLDLVRQLRERIPNIVLTSDVIVGFPGETQEEFEETMRLVEEVGYDALFTFIFSPRRGTPAEKLPDPMPKEQKSANFQRLLQRQNEISAQKHQAYVGKTLRCLVDGVGADGRLTARTDGGRLIHLEADPALVGTWQQAEITGSSTWALFGRVV
ncbi:MAG: tRNA (N6-isopentenyl adenosine(37)-C2)-methylthiotransferase MiaB [Evtepia sp.]|uniref:tRNA (N6-isopentenyl adenosine(37)-C2)-methylthiotransferase MiaB n=1 Tax=Evtepia sp. TaxID=2773933 RepID=UPI002A74893F|nr:tRNA (N6-isopentenyl adenosine(37)-C2)-methylthiotransferase MiaB [Evtepia sp.]MDY3015401.1 tRNA (N6-isopentenyl adenosine(37)-C2)-methylthiotransferase MiaB [Evtepia sp.]